MVITVTDELREGIVAALEGVVVREDPRSDSISPMVSLSSLSEVASSSHSH